MDFVITLGDLIGLVFTGLIFAVFMLAAVTEWVKKNLRRFRGK